MAKASLLIGCILITLIVASAALLNSPSAVAYKSFQIADLSYNPSRLTQFKLPKKLREISGLALNNAQQLFAHNDEAGVIYQIDYEQGMVIRRYKLQEQTKKDFEAIAATDKELFLITSKGALYQMPLDDIDLHKAPDDVPLSFQRHKTGIDCEIEGLTYLSSEQMLYIACKNLRKRDKGTAIRIHRRRIDAGKLSEIESLSVTVQDLQSLLGRSSSLQPSGITFANNGNLIIIAGRQNLLIELTTTGDLVGYAELPSSRHTQPEGIAITNKGQLLLADEGDGKGDNKFRGRLSVYHPD